MIDRVPRIDEHDSATAYAIEGSESDVSINSGNRRPSRRFDS